MLTKEDPHYWHPILQVMHWLADCVIEPKAFVVDVGCGRFPFERANVGVDRLNHKALEKMWGEIGITRNLKVTQHDFARQTLPFKDKEVDFVFCRHTLEDMYDPFSLLAEMNRVGKAGYIETPSPIAEFVRGVDGAPAEWRGYHHHRWVVWTHGDTLNFVTKYPFVERLGSNVEPEMETLLKSNPLWWNTYYLWNNEIKWKHWENPIDFEFGTEYPKLLGDAAVQSVKSGRAFGERVDRHGREEAA
jgi:hypothetical protein